MGRQQKYHFRAPCSIHCHISVKNRKPGYLIPKSTLQWRHNERDGVSNHWRLYCLFNRLFRRIYKKTSKLRVIGPWEGNPPVTGGFPSQRANNAENFPFDDVIVKTVTHLGRNRLVRVLQGHFRVWRLMGLAQMSSKFVPKSQNDKEWALTQGMDWRQTVNRLLTAAANYGRVQWRA